MIAYQYDAAGYYAGKIEDYGILPNNATYTAPNLQDGYVHRWNGKKWDQVENHKGKQGYVDGQPFIVTDYGPLPDGWSETPPPPTLSEVISDYEARIQARLDNFARTLGYDSILSACSYATSNVEVYRIEGQYCVDARDATWAKAYDLLQALQPIVEADGAIPAWEEIEAHLQPLAWPAGSRGYKGE